MQNQCVYSHDWMDDAQANFVFQIQILHICHISNGDGVYTDNVYKINSIYIVFSASFNLSI